MSYDLMAFDPEAAPRARAPFMDWYRERLAWEEPRDRASLTGGLPRFYDLMRASFPPRTGPDAPAMEPRGRGLMDRLLGRPGPPPVNRALLADYSFAGTAVRVGFSWSMARTAHRTMLVAARDAGVGFFDASATGGAILHEPAQIDDLLNAL